MSTYIEATPVSNRKAVDVDTTAMAGFRHRPAAHRHITVPTQSESETNAGESSSGPAYEHRRCEFDGSQVTLNHRQAGRTQ